MLTTWIVRDPSTRAVEQFRLMMFYLTHDPELKCQFYVIHFRIVRHVDYEPYCAMRLLSNLLGTWK